MVTETDTPLLIHAKLYRPPIARDLAPLPRLLKRLDWRRERPATLVVAPAGYGKTMLITSWLGRAIGPVPCCRLARITTNLACF